MRNTTDIHRPRYHFLPAANWMNDPNGVIQWRGVYHLFFQYNPDGAYHANMHWGHAVSDDLLHWQEQPIALAPTPGSADRGGIFSGCLVDDDGLPSALYTGVNQDYSVQTQCLARGNSDLTRWEKYAGNPIIARMPPGLGQARDFRDPFVWRGQDGWNMALGSRIAGVGGAVLLYRSPDLLRWQYIQPLFVGDRARHGDNFECPNLFPLAEQWVLMLAAEFAGGQAHELYFLGDYDGQRFRPEREGIYDPGYSYAALSYADERGRRLLHSWIRESRSVDAQRKAGWSGVQAIPRVLSLDARQRLISQPVPELERLRRRHWRFCSGDCADGQLPLRAMALDIVATLDVQAAAHCGIELLRTPDGAEKLQLRYDRDTSVLHIERHYRRADADIDCASAGFYHPLDPGERLQLRLLLDHSLLEIIANSRASYTTRFYASSAESSGAALIAPQALHTLDLWEMASIY